MFQIMGFNYTYCGCSRRRGVRRVAARGRGGQLECYAFARFVARPPYLEALQAKDWETFAKAYNGPQHAKNNYAPKDGGGLRDRSQRSARAARKRRRTRQSPADGSALPPGRATFVPVRCGAQAHRAQAQRAPRLRRPARLGVSARDRVAPPHGCGRNRRAR